MNTLGERIKEIRKNNELTQQEFANKLSVSRPFISRVEANKEMPSDSLMKLMCATFGIKFSWLKQGIGSKDNNQPPYKEVQSYILNEQMLSNIVNSAEQQNFSFCCSVLVSIFKNTDVKDNSNIFYQEHIKSLLVTIDYYLKNANRSCNSFDFNEYEEFELKKKIEQEFIKNISSNISETLRAFQEENLNDIEIE